MARLMTGVVVPVATVMGAVPVTFVTVPLPLLLNVVQSVLLSTPVVVALAFCMVMFVAAVTRPSASMANCGITFVFPYVAAVTPELAKLMTGVVVPVDTVTGAVPLTLLTVPPTGRVCGCQLVPVHVNTWPVLIGLAGTLVLVHLVPSHINNCPTWVGALAARFTFKPVKMLIWLPLINSVGVLP